RSSKLDTRRDNQRPLPARSGAMNLTQTERLFEPVGQIRGGLFLLAAKDALRFVEECERKGIDILGVEGFRIVGERFQPLQEHSFDLEGHTSDNHNVAKRFIQQRLADEVWFEVVTSDRAEDQSPS